MPGIEIDNDNAEIRVDGYEYAASKISIKTYGISSAISQTLNSADLRLTDSDGYTDNVTVSGGSNVTITRNNVNKFTIDSYNSDTTYSIGASSSASPLGAKISLNDSNNVMDNVFIVQGTGIGVAYSGSPDSITVSNVGVTQVNPGAGITVSGATGNVTVAMSQTTLTKATNSIISDSANTNILNTGVIPINNTIEISGIILFAFLPGGATNTFDITLSTGSGSIVGNTSKVAVGFTCHAGGVAGSFGEAIKNVPTFTYPQQITNTNNHVIRFSGLFQTDNTTPNSLIINMKNNNSGVGENLVVYAKSFITYNVI
jgi:hypothetical protein